MPGILTRAVRHAKIEQCTLGEKNIERQKALIAELELDRHDTARARNTLWQFEELQALHVAERERLAQELVDCGNSEKS